MELTIFGEAVEVVKHMKAGLMEVMAAQEEAVEVQFILALAAQVVEPLKIVVETVGLDTMQQEVTLELIQAEVAVEGQLILVEEETVGLE
jgi:hypothetical protein